MSSSQIKSGALLSYLSLFLGSAISIVYTPIMLRSLGQSEYGLMSLANSVVGYLGLLNLGIGSAMVRYIAKYKAEENKVMEHSIITLFLFVFIGLAIVVMLAGICLIYHIHGLFDESLTDREFLRLQILMGLMTFNIAMGMVSSVFYAVMMAYERFVFTKVIGIINTVLNPLIMLPLLFLGFQSVGITVASTVLNVINILIVGVYSFKILKIKIHPQKFEKSFLKELFGFSFFVLLAMIVDKVYWGTDQFILGAISGSIAVAVYNVGANFTTYFMSFSTAITGLFLPRLTEMEVKNVSNAEFDNLFVKVGRVQFLILCFILGGFIVLGKQFIILWAGKDYESAYYIALVILIPFVIPLIQNLGLQLMYARNKHKFRSLMLLGIAVLNVLFSIPCAKIYGGIGCAIVTGISFIIGQGFILNWYYYKKMGLNIPLFWKSIMSMFVTFLVILLVLFGIFDFFKCDSWLTFALGAVIYAIIYLVGMWIFAMNQYEHQLVKSYIPILKIKR